MHAISSYLGAYNIYNIITLGLF